MPTFGVRTRYFTVQDLRGFHLESSGGLQVSLVLIFVLSFHIPGIRRAVIFVEHHKSISNHSGITDVS